MSSTPARRSGTGEPAPVVGLVPAAGRGTRLGRLPCSKEILPVGNLRGSDEGDAEPRPPTLASHGLLAAFRLAAIDTAYVALGDGKWDVPAALGDGGPEGPKLAYVPVAGSRSVPESLDRLYPWVADRVCALGFPDVWFRPADAFARLLAARRRRGAEVALGCFPTDRPQRTDMVELADDGEVLRIDVRPPTSELRFNWLLAVWGPAFCERLHAEVARSLAGPASPEGGELQLGEVFRRALASGLFFTGVRFPDGTFCDLGTPGELADAWRRGHPLPR